MKFYIFASDDSSTFTCSINQNVYCSNSYDDCRREFDRLNSEYKYAHSYLVADFGTKPKASLFSSNDCSLSAEFLADKEYMPFLLIGEFHYNGMGDCTTLTESGEIDLNKAIRCDAIKIKLDGFTQIFNNNENAVRSFISNLESKVPAEMYITFSISYFDTDDILPKTTLLTRLVADTVDVIRNGDKTCITKLQLCPNPYNEYIKTLNKKATVIG